MTSTMGSNGCGSMGNHEQTRDDTSKAAINRIYGITRSLTYEEVYAEIENLMRRRSDLDYKQERLAAALHLELDNT